MTNREGPEVTDAEMPEPVQAARAYLERLGEVGYRRAIEDALRIVREQPNYPDTHTGVRQQWVRDQIAARLTTLCEQREPGWYWVRWAEGWFWRPAEFRHGYWFHHYDQQNIATTFVPFEVGPRILAPDEPPGE
jgi:hypothetical protein